jgi:hypothetical protein
MDNLTLQHSTITLPARGARSLTWDGDHLVDWLVGVRWSLDGASERIAPEQDECFDAVAACGPYAVVHQRLGTRGQLLRNGRLVRELTRDDYCADVYAYPVCLWQTPAGRTLIAHCPDRYCRLDIEDAETGLRLTASDTRKPGDFFHSRLQVNASGTRLLSAGWYWHPWDMVGHVELQRALEDPCHLDELQFDRQFLVEQSSACWQTDHRILIGASDETACDDEYGSGPTLRPHGIAVYDLRDRRVVSDIVLPYTSGTIMPVGLERAVTFNGHPRLVCLVSGAVLHEWPELPSGRQLSSIIHHIERPPPLALDAARARFALLRGDEIVVVRLEP